MRAPMRAKRASRRILMTLPLVLGAVAAGVAERTRDDEYRALVQQYRWRATAQDRP